VVALATMVEKMQYTSIRLMLLLPSMLLPFLLLPSEQKDTRAPILTAHSSGIGEGVPVSQKKNAGVPESVEREVWHSTTVDIRMDHQLQQGSPVLLHPESLEGGQLSITRTARILMILFALVALGYSLLCGSCRVWDPHWWSQGTRPEGNDYLKTS
jgi:hypothetical protein